MTSRFHCIVIFFVLSFSLYLFSLLNPLYSQTTKLETFFPTVYTKLRVHKNQIYGTKLPPRQNFDLITFDNQKKNPLVIYFHGGSFTHGDKRDIFKDRKRVDDIHFLLKKGIAFASVNYRLLNRLPLEHKGVIKSLYDAKFALQYIRFHANKYNIDPAKIVLWGNSAGASICLWLTVSDDMAKIESNNPIKKESTKVLASVLTETQASLDVFQWETVFQDYEISIPKVIHRNKSFRKRVLQLYGQSNISDLKTESTKRYRERIDSLSKIDSLDPEIWIKNTKTENNYPLNDRGLSLHHPYHAKTIHEHYLSVGAPISAYYGPNSSLFKDPSNENHLDFILRLLE